MLDTRITGFTSVKLHEASRRSCSRSRKTYCFYRVCYCKKNFQLLVYEPKSRYNGTPRWLKNCNEGGCRICNGTLPSDGERECICLHAEENAISEAGRERVGVGAVLYCNTWVHNVRSNLSTDSLSQLSMRKVHNQDHTKRCERGGV